MKPFNLNRISKIIVKIYFVIAFILIIAEFLQQGNLLLIFKPLLIPTLMVLYFLTSKVKNIFYLVSLFFALCSNVFFLSTAREFLLYGFLAFMIYRILSIVVVLKLLSKQSLLPFVIACLPFIFIFSSLFNLTMDSLYTSFYPTMINGILISILAGISLSNYVLDDNRINYWLAISTLLFVTLVFLFMIQKYYLSNDIFQPISALIFTAAHFSFYKFVLASERIKDPETLNNN